MLVLGLLEPPLIKTRPSGRLVVPGQKKSAPVFVTTRSVAVSVAGSKIAVKVWPGLLPISVSKLNVSNADHISSLPLGRLATPIGFTGKGMTLDQEEGS